ncbi:MAG: hypothetical protein CMJ48_14325 [Planctomycetaceae bacterium]|nr:hypothetical protein [Planctomycetaceae bacterium]
MASSSKPTAVHFSLIFFALASIILGVVCYLNFKDLRKSQGAEAAAKKKSNDDGTQLRITLDEFEAVKKKLGHESAETGLNAPTPGTVLGDMAEAIGKHAPDVATGTYLAALENGTTRLVAAQQELDQNRVLISQLQAKITSLEDEYQSKTNVAEKAREDAEKDRAEAQETKEEQVAALTVQVNEANESFQDTARALQDSQQAHDDDNKRHREEFSLLTARNEKLQSDFDEATRISFEVPDGAVRWVDNLSRMIWINLGEVDALPVGATFSVYTKAHHGVARGPEDIKGSIEVTRVLGAHLAEARILDEELAQPMSPGDPIYTPLWSRGRKETFSLVGSFDLNGDGKADRKLLHEIIATNNATVDFEVLEDGRRIRYIKYPDVFEEWTEDDPGIGVTNKFMVVGAMPDPNNATTEEQKQQLDEIITHQTNMRKEARSQGIRIVNMSDFLSYIGFVPRQRLFRPGDGRPFTLKSGAHSTATNSTLGARQAAGQVSGAYSRKIERLKQKTSSGQTSKKFGN